jgi:hypothetical protein
MLAGMRQLRRTSLILQDDKCKPQVQIQTWDGKHPTSASLATPHLQMKFISVSQEIHTVAVPNECANYVAAGSNLEDLPA